MHRSIGEVTSGSISSYMEGLSLTHFILKLFVVIGKNNVKGVNCREDSILVDNGKPSGRKKTSRNHVGIYQLNRSIWVENSLDPHIWGSQPSARTFENARS
jgi:hypothetical protein